MNSSNNNNNNNILYSNSLTNSSSKSILTNNINNTSDSNKENIKVIVRIRPRIERELDQGPYIKVDGNSIITSNKSEMKQYNYDYIATEDSSQSEIFDHCARNIADSTLQGYNGTIFVYGQTGAGKTYTLLGPKFSTLGAANSANSLNNPNSLNNSQMEDDGMMPGVRHQPRKDEESKGVLPRVIEYLFERAKNVDNSPLSSINAMNAITFSCSFLEIYQEQISDLLDGSVNKQICIRDFSDSVIVEGLSKIQVNSADEALNLVQKGIKLRHVGSTSMNSESSRSHAVFSIYIENKQKALGGKFKTKKSVFHLIDLAGSERQKLTEAFGERLKEAGKINKSLMQLGHVIKSLLDIAEGRKCHIHYRDSKLTHLLKDSLGGNSKTCIIANISPANCNFHETISTLVFAQNAKLIKNKAIINEEMTNDIAYREEIKKLRDKYNSIKAENLYLLSIIEKTKNDSKTPNQKSDFVDNLDFVEEEIETMVSEMVKKEEQIKTLKSDNDFLKDEVQSCEIKLRLKEKELREHKEMLNTIKLEHELIQKQLPEYVLKDALMSQNILKLETQMQNKEFSLSKEIESLKNVIEENKKQIQMKEITIVSINIEIKNYMMLINQRDVKINELRIELDERAQENEELRVEILNRQNQEDNLKNEIEHTKHILESKEVDIKLQEERLNDLRQKGKTLVNQYDTKIENLKLNYSKLDEDLKRKQFENKNLNLLITDLKKERDFCDEKVFGLMDDFKRLTCDKELLKEENFRLVDEMRTLRNEMIKLMEENEMLSDNKNSNNNKVSLLNKLKQENSKLKEEVNEFRKNYEYLEKTFNLSKSINKSKMTLIDFASIMNSKDADLNNCKRILHASVLKLKSLFENNSDEFSFTLKENMKNFIEGKSLEERFEYYLDKQLKYLDYKEKKEKILRDEIDAKESKILTLNREIFLRNNYDEEHVANGNGVGGFGGFPKTQSKKRHSVGGSNIINSVLNSEVSKSLFKTNNKRKFREIENPISVGPLMQNIPNNYNNYNNNNVTKNSDTFMNTTNGNFVVVTLNPAGTDNSTTNNNNNHNIITPNPIIILNGNENNLNGSGDGYNILDNNNIVDNNFSSHFSSQFSEI